MMTETIYIQMCNNMAYIIKDLDHGFPSSDGWVVMEESGDVNYAILMESMFDEEFEDGL